MIYFSMIERIDPGEDEDTTPEDIRQRLDQELMVSQWRTPGAEPEFTPTEDRPPEAPSWWVSDEEASQSFLKSQGVFL